MGTGCGPVPVTERDQASGLGCDLPSMRFTILGCRFRQLRTYQPVLGVRASGLHALVQRPAERLRLPLPPAYAQEPGETAPCNPGGLPPGGVRPGHQPDTGYQALPAPEIAKSPVAGPHRRPGHHAWIRPDPITASSGAVHPDRRAALHRLAPQDPKTRPLGLHPHRPGHRPLAAAASSLPARNRPPGRIRPSATSVTAPSNESPLPTARARLQSASRTTTSPSPASRARHLEARPLAAGAHRPIMHTMTGYARVHSA